MIIDNDPPIERSISVPRDMSQLSCSSFTAGIVEAVLDGLGFVRPLPPLCRSLSLMNCPARARHFAQHAHSTVSKPNDDPHQARAICAGEGGALEDLIECAVTVVFCTYIARSNIRTVDFMIPPRCRRPIFMYCRVNGLSCSAQLESALHGRYRHSQDRPSPRQHRLRVGVRI